MTPPCKKVRNLLCYPSFDFSDEEVERRLGHRWTGSEVGPESLVSKPTCFPSQQPADTPALGRAMPQGAPDPSRFS